MRTRPTFLATMFVVGALFTTSACGFLDDDKESASPSPSPALESPSPTVTGNGIEKLSGTEILAKARAASSAAKSVHVTGEFSEEGQTIGLDIQVAGESSKGTLTIGTSTLEIIRVGTTVYFKGSRAFWEENGGETVANLLADKYLRTTTTDEDFQGLASLTDTRQIFDAVLPADSEVTKGDIKEIDGEKAIELNVTTSDGTNQVYVQSTGEPYVLRIIDDPAGELNFTDWDEPVTVELPPQDQIIDASELGGE